MILRGVFGAVAGVLLIVALGLAVLALAGCAERPIKLEPQEGRAGWNSWLACPECNWKTGVQR